MRKNAGKIYSAQGMVRAAEIGEDIRRGIDRALGNVIATCPFCGGTYAAGYLDDANRAPGPPGEPQAVIRHTQPPCRRFMVNARIFLTDANKRARDRRRID